MSTVQEHYASLLAPIYVWMAGGYEAAFQLGAQDVAMLGDGNGRIAIDLGAGFGMHSVPLAERGFVVTAVDTSAMLLWKLQEQADERGLYGILTGECDLLEFLKHNPEAADVILCMGDTLTHLGSQEDVRGLFQQVAAALKPGGTFLCTFRDYSNPLTGDARFIPVRSDDERILTCFLEECGSHMRVHDLLYTRGREGWAFRASSYLKLRLDPAWVVAALQEAGLRAALEAGPRGMKQVTATN